MTKTQGWIIIALLVVAIIVGLGAFWLYNNDHKTTEGQAIAYCLNECKVQAKNATTQDLSNNSCMVSCLEGKGVAVKGINAPPYATSTTTGGVHTLLK